VRKLSDENDVIADWLVKLAGAKKAWGCGLCYLHLRNVRGFGWNHKRVYRIYCELELNLRIRSRKRLQREKPEPLAVPEAPSHITIMHIQPGKPQQNAYIERYNRTVRQEWLGRYIFETIRRYTITPHDGYGHTTTNDQTWASAV
jgi:hypothetical protein